MRKTRHVLELLAPAKTAEFGIEAVKHGADAVYIGGPAFGARSKAGNSVADIAKLVAYAHRFHAQVFVALNTIFHDNELEAVRNLVYQCYDNGVDALIVQDMGLLEMDLPPIQLHASTQTDIRTVEKAQFLEGVGFSQIVLARELDLASINAIARATSCQLEYFIHGALCVAMSGQCYISHAHTGRSANRGECAQECRLPYRLEDGQGRVLGNDKHYLSLKDNDQSRNLEALIKAGVSSFKIEGRYKDITYLKNTTAYYRQLIDQFIANNSNYQRASTGISHYQFEPNPEKTFNRNATDYFTRGRQADIGAFDTPKFAGEEIGRVLRVNKDRLEIDAKVTLHNGDGISFFDVHKTLVGMSINHIDGGWITPNEMPEGIQKGMTIYRNRDHAYLRVLEKESAVRKIRVNFHWAETSDGFSLTATDEDGYIEKITQAHEKIQAHDNSLSMSVLKQNLSKLGTTDFELMDLTTSIHGNWFVPASMINHMRREVISRLAESRRFNYQRPLRSPATQPPVQYPEETLSYLANVYNHLARSFYHKHGVKVIAAAYELNQEIGEVPLMITKHCLRYSHSMCPKEAKGVLGVQGTVTAEPMTLIHGTERFTLKFDCKACEMHVMGKLRRSVARMPAPQPIEFFRSRP
jgi:23S rRNA 5-hydroxycytidine C2501 synthase